MWTGNWWWEVQDQLPDGATVAPIILASDETQLSTFSGDKKAWPLYLTVGNIEKRVRRKPTSRAWILLGYIPVSSLECFSKERRSVEGCQLFHDCVKKMLQLLIEKGIQATEMGCSDGFIRSIYALLAAYIACCRENSCPQCNVKPRDRGEWKPRSSVYRDPEDVIATLAKQSQV
ncbi:hypothetical protein F5877DRAFT_55398 [Lentinula edodes]|nr:hypothetical protein F5877DRAFT_55398 [Lentinula edodes]